MRVVAEAVFRRKAIIQFLVQRVRVSKSRFSMRAVTDQKRRQDEFHFECICRYDQKRSIVTFRNPRSFDPENLDVH